MTELREIAQLPVRVRTTSRLLRLCPVGIPGRTRSPSYCSAEFSRPRRQHPRADHLKFLVPSLREPIAFHLLIDGEVRSARRFACCFGSSPPGATFVDVGANIGVFTLPAARKVGSQGRIVGVEASPTVFPYLEHNVAVNDLANICSQAMRPLRHATTGWLNFMKLR